MIPSNDARVEFHAAMAPQLRAWGISLGDEQIETLWRYYGRVIETNRQFNLTRIVEPRDFAVRHVLDSLAVVAWAASVNHSISTVLDIGTGAGVPAVPLAIARPDWRITAIDGTAKKALFVQSCVVELRLTNVQCLHARAESRRALGPFDLAVLKAVGSLEPCLRLARPHVRFGGHAVMFKTASISVEERDDGNRSAREIGFAAPELFHYSLSASVTEQLERELWVYRLTRR